MKIIIVSLTVLIIFSSCISREGTREDVHKTDSSSITYLLQAGIDTGKPEQRIMPDEVECKGIIEVIPEGRIFVSFPYACYLSIGQVSRGQAVEKGDTLALVEHPELIGLQQEYLEKKNQLEFFREEYKRQGELAVERAASLKKMQQAESEFKSLEIEVVSLEAKLKMIGVNTKTLDAESISAVVPLLSPAKGYISRDYVIRGRYFKPEEVIFEIINRSALQLQLEIAGADIQKVKRGLPVVFETIHTSGVYYHARIESKGIEMDPNGQMISVSARILDANDRLLPGMKVKACMTADPVKAYAIPVQALVCENDSCFVFALREGRLMKTYVRISTEKEGYVRLIEPDEVLYTRTIVIGGIEKIGNQAE